MLRRLSQREQIAILLDQFSLAIRTAFIEAVAEIRSRITLSLVIERLEKRDVPGAIEALGIERSAFNPVLDQIAAAFNAGGTGAAEQMAIRDPEGHRVTFRFDYRNPAAEAWLKDHSSTLVTRIVDDQRQAVRAALSAGLAVGDNPRRTALNIVGRVNRVTGSREGGIIGLTAQQAGYVEAAEAELLSGDAEVTRRFLGRQRRDRRFDGAVKKAIAEGKPLPRETVSRIVGRYSDRLLQLRGEMLGRTETMTALNVAQDLAMRQAITEGKVDQNVVTKVWHSAGDDRVRHSHRALNGQSAPLDGVFISPSGAALRFPGDPNAPTAETVGCRCWVRHEIDFLAGLK